MGNYFSSFNQQITYSINNIKIDKLNKFARYKNEPLHVDYLKNKIYIPSLPSIKE